jgi:hypothetical protein
VGCGQLLGNAMVAEIASRPKNAGLSAKAIARFRPGAAKPAK